jgi:hypothetical protein
MVYNNNNNNLNNDYVTKFKDDIVNHPYIMLALILGAIFVIIYFIYVYAIQDTSLQGYTYYANDILKLDPLFTENVGNSEECINICKNYSNCDGITYDTNTSTCIGQKNGRLRTDDDNYIAWVKKSTSNKLKNTGNIDTLKDIKPIISYIKSDTSANIASKDLPNPAFPDSFSYHFIINIQDWYENYSYWRHILHKGTPIDKTVNNKTRNIEYTNWEKIINDIPEQTAGFWLTPFQNNLRIAVTTMSQTPKPRTYEHANIEKCKCNETDYLKGNPRQADIHCSNCWITDQEGDVEHEQDKNQDFKDYQSIDYIDIQDLQTNIPTQIDVSVKGNIIEVYVNGTFKNSKILNGKAVWNNGYLYVHNPKTYKGELSDLKILPGAITGEHVKKLYNEYFSNK